MTRRIPVLVLSFVLLVPLVAYGGQLGTLSTADSQDALDPRWLPWLGCWDLQADAVDYRQTTDLARRTVCVSARPDGRGVNISTFVDGTVALEETLLADGERHSLVRNACSGWQEARWSRDGHRLLSRAELECDQGPDRSFSGLSLLASGDVWVDVETVGLDDHRELLVRRYRRTRDEVVEELGLAPLAPERALAAADARARAAAPLEVDDVIEAAEQLPPEAVEAAILESDSTFEIDADTLVRLADAGLPDEVVDLMVAVSFPDHFVVDRGEPDAGPGAAPPRGRRGGHVGYPYPGYGLYGPYPAYWFYDPFFTPFHFGSSVRFPGRVIRVRPSVPETGSLFGGRVIQGKGYARVRARSRSDGGGFLGRMVNGAIGSGSRVGSSGGSSAAGDGDGGATASPKGFTRGGSGGRKAVRRGGSGDEGGKGGKGGKSGSGQS